MIDHGLLNYDWVSKQVGQIPLVDAQEILFLSLVLKALELDSFAP